MALRISTQPGPDGGATCAVTTAIGSASAPPTAAPIADRGSIVAVRRVRRVAPALAHLRTPACQSRARSSPCHARLTWQAECVWLLQALLRTLGAAIRGQPLLGERCWQQLGGSEGLARLLRQTAVLHTEHAGAVLASLLELCTGGTHRPEQPQAATAAFSLAVQLQDDGVLLRLLSACHALASGCEAAAVQLSRAGLLVEALRWLLTPVQPARVEGPRRPGAADGHPPRPAARAGLERAARAQVAAACRDAARHRPDRRHVVAVDAGPHPALELAAMLALRLAAATRRAHERRHP